MGNVDGDLVGEVHDVFLAEEKGGHEVDRACRGDIRGRWGTLRLDAESNKSGEVGGKDDGEELSVRREEVDYNDTWLALKHYGLNKSLQLR